MAPVKGDYPIYPKPLPGQRAYRDPTTGRLVTMSSTILYNSIGNSYVFQDDRWWEDFRSPSNVHKKKTRPFDIEPLLKVTELENVPFYSNEYFSSTNMSIYIGDVFVDEVTDLTFAVHSTVRPVYGYRSRNFDMVLRDNVVVVGAFAMNFKTNGYLYMILERYKQFQYSSVAGLKSRADASNAIRNIYLDDPSVREQVFRSNLEDALDDRSLYELLGEGQLDNQEKAALNLLSNNQRSEVRRRKEIVNTLAGLRSGHRNKEDYIRAVRRRKRQVWKTVGRQTRKLDEFNFKGYDEESTNMQTGVLEQMPFHIVIVYGDPDSALVHDKFEERKEQSNYEAPTTTKVLKNVIITSVTQEVDLSGKPIREIYKFIARNVF